MNKGERGIELCTIKRGNNVPERKEFRIKVTKLFGLRVSDERGDHRPSLAFLGQQLELSYILIRGYII